MKPRFFATQAAFRAWLEEHHETADELLVGFHKKASGKPSITWPQSVDEALCFGWIDGVRRTLDETSYTIRFTPRRERSVWSDINIRRAKELVEQGLMRPAGLRAFDKRDEAGAAYSYQRRQAAELDAESEGAFRANAAAWAYFQSRPPWYRRTAIHWVVSAKKDETRRSRLATLIDDSAHERPIKPLRRPS
ncbi:MAG TPA: YdeI/OmpD-associated family protein [Candidatus Elarobacter sp.]|nr:YdeI/OmpD-associated family protein [Candidatus Elarobacter sp.]